MLDANEIKKIQYAWLYNRAADDDTYKKPWFWEKSTTPRAFVDIRFGGLPLYRIPYHHLLDFSIKLGSTEGVIGVNGGGIAFYDETSLFVYALMLYAVQSTSVNIAGIPASIRFGWYDPNRQNHSALISQWYPIMIGKVDFDIDRGGGVRFKCTFVSGSSYVFSNINNTQSKLGPFDTLLGNDSISSVVREWILNELKRANSSIISPVGPIAYNDIHIVFEDEPAPVTNDAGDTFTINLDVGKPLSDNIELMRSFLRTNSGEPFSYKAELLNKPLDQGFEYIITFYSQADRSKRMTQSDKTPPFIWTFPTQQPEILDVSFAQQKSNLAAAFSNFIRPSDSTVSQIKSEVGNLQPETDLDINKLREAFKIPGNMDRNKLSAAMADLKEKLRMAAGTIASVKLRGEPQLSYDYIGVPFVLKYNVVNSASYRFHKGATTTQELLNGLRLNDIDNSNIAFVVEIANQIQFGREEGQDRFQSPWDGRYVINDIEHTIGSDGFITNVTAVKLDLTGKTVI